MYPPMQNDDDEEEEEEEEEEELYSCDESDDGFNEDMEALRRACTVAGTNLDQLNIDNTRSPSPADAYGSDDDVELFRNIKTRFSIPMSDFDEPLSLKPLCALPPDLEDDAYNDFETLCAVQRRFAAYDNTDIMRGKVENLVEKPEARKASKVFPHTEEGDHATSLFSDDKEIQQYQLLRDNDDTHVLPSLGLLQDSSSFPKSAQVFLDAIKRNRSCQKFLRSKLVQIEARIEENRKLKERVKLFRDLQVSCKKVTGRALAQGKDPRIQLISAQRTLSSRNSKVNDYKVSAMHNGPVENSHAINFRTALENFPHMLKHKKWTQKEKENLRKGIRQQFQEMLLQISVDQLSGSEGSSGDAYNLDAVFSSIRDLEITPERIREFLPKVNWDQLASLYVPGRTGAECEAHTHPQSS